MVQLVHNGALVNFNIPFVESRSGSIKKVSRGQANTTFIYLNRNTKDLLL